MLGEKNFIPKFEIELIKFNKISSNIDYQTKLKIWRVMVIQIDTYTKLIIYTGEIM